MLHARGSQLKCRGLMVLHADKLRLAAEVTKAPSTAGSWCFLSACLLLMRRLACNIGSPLDGILMHEQNGSTGSLCTVLHCPCQPCICQSSESRNLGRVFPLAVPPAANQANNCFNVTLCNSYPRHSPTRRLIDWCTCWGQYKPGHPQNPGAELTITVSSLNGHQKPTSLLAHGFMTTEDNPWCTGMHGMCNANPQ